MADAWGGSFGSAWGSSWGDSGTPTPTPTPPTATPVGGGGKPWKQKWRQELVDMLWERKNDGPQKLPIRLKKKIQKALEVLPDDSDAIVALKADLERLQAPQAVDTPRMDIMVRHFEALQREIQRRRDDEDDDEAIVLLLH